MAIYFPRGFHSGEPVRVVDGVTVVRGVLARQPAELIVVASPRTILGAPASGAARAALGAGPSRRVRALPRGSRAVHELAGDAASRRWLAFLEVSDEPPSAAALAEVVDLIAAFAAERGAREVALAPFGCDPRAARAWVEALRVRPSPPRWIVVLRERAQFEAAAGAAAASPTSP